MATQEWKVRPQIVNLNSDEPVFYPFSICKNMCFLCSKRLKC